MTEDELAHFGVKGMKWGVRKSEDRAAKPAVRQKYDNLSVPLKGGGSLTLDGDKVGLISRKLGNYSQRVRDNIEKSPTFKLRDSKGQLVGEMALHKESKDSLNVMWVGVDDKFRGRGYATGAMNAAVSYAKRQNMKQVTLEVPGIAPDARHIYEKMGFVVDKEQSSKSTHGEVDAFWGGLTSMTLKIKGGSR